MISTRASFETTNRVLISPSSLQVRNTQEFLKQSYRDAMIHFYFFIHFSKKNSICSEDAKEIQTRCGRVRRQQHACICDES